MLSKHELLDRMVKIKNNRNYKNILLFPTLEGFTTDQVPAEIMKINQVNNFLHPQTPDILQDEQCDSGGKFYDPKKPYKSSGVGQSQYGQKNNTTVNINSKDNKPKTTKILNNDQTYKLDNLNTFIDELNESDAEFLLEDTIDALGDIIDEINIPDEIPENLDDIKDMLNPESLAVFFLGIENFFMFFISLFNNILIYFSIVIAQLSYGNLPITPFENISAPPTTPNWPWKLDLNIDPSDNIAINPKATLLNANGPPLLIGNTYVPASVYAENQQILYDSSIIYSIFTQIILVIVTWVFTNNAYYYIYYDSTSLPLRVISPENITEEGVVEVKKGSLIFYTVLNTLIASPFDILIYIFKGIKWSAKLIYLYNFPSLLYILLFMIILYFNLTYFWDLYSKFINKPFEWVQDPFFLSFMLYGVIRHYLLVNTITSINMGPTITNFITWCLYSIFIIFVISGVLYAGYPVMRIAFYIWFIYVFFGFYGFSSNAYEDILKHENKKCESNKFKIGTFIRDAVVYFYSYFFYFVLFVLIISNFIYLGENPMKNSNSSSAIKLVLSIFFLFALMYLVYYILNKKSAKSNTNVEYGESYTKPENKNDLINKLQQKIVNVNAFQTDPITIPKDVNHPPITIPKDVNHPPITIPDNTTLSSSESVVLKNEFLQRLIQDIDTSTELLGGDKNIANFKKKIQEVDGIFNEIAEVYKTPINIQSITEGIETKLQKYNGPYKDKLNQVLNFFKEIILMKIDTNISNFYNRVVAIINKSGQEVKDILVKKQNGGEGEEIQLPPEKEENMNDILINTTFMTEIQNAYVEEISGIQNKLASMIRGHFQSEIQIAISITQIYNSGFAIAFSNAQPEIGMFCYIVTQLFPNETKASIRNTIGSVASIGYNSIKSRLGKFGNMFGSKPVAAENQSSVVE